MRTFVVSDAHGRHREVRALLRAAGIVDEQGRRVRDAEVRTVQVGDLVNATRSTREDDVAILGYAHGWFDVLLIGNHEYPYLGGYAFGGFEAFPDVRSAVEALPWRPAVAVGGTLVTHAGVAELIGVQSSSAGEAAVEIAEAWLADPGHPFFAACSPARAGGRQMVGGVLWRDASEPRSLAFPQVHGHTPRQDGPEFVGDPSGSWCANLDVGARSGRVSGLWLDERGAPIRALLAEPE